jgi:hypothetical protein
MRVPLFFAIPNSILKISTLNYSIRSVRHDGQDGNKKKKKVLGLLSRSRKFLQIPCVPCHPNQSILKGLFVNDDVNKE